MTTNTLVRSATGYVKAAGNKLPTFCLSAQVEDRGGDLIEIDGIDTKAFETNPVAMWSHDYRIPPVGAWQNLRRVGGELLGDLKFDPGDPFARQLADKVSRGFVNAVSVGLRVFKSEPRASGGRTYKKSELLEVSLVSVPMNQSALRKGVDQDDPAVTILPGERPGEFVVSRSLGYADLMRAYQRQRLTQAWRQARPEMEADYGIARGFDRIESLARRIAEKG